MGRGEKCWIARRNNNSQQKVDLYLIEDTQRKALICLFH